MLDPITNPSLKNLALKPFLLFLACASISFLASGETSAKNRKTASSDSSWCAAKAWNGSRDLSLRLLKSKLDEMSRLEVVQSAWSELLENPKQSMAMPLLHYLAHTEGSEDLHGYYLSMGYLASDGVTPTDAVKKWPERVPMSRTQFPISELCRLYKKSGGETQ